MLKRLLLVVLAVGLTAGCAMKQPPAATVPGAIDQIDQYAFRVIADAQAAIHSVKTFQQCTVQNFPPTVSVDSAIEACDASNGKFKPEWTGALNAAIDSYKTASELGKAYHAGAGDAAALNGAITQLNSNVTVMLSRTGGK